MNAFIVGEKGGLYDKTNPDWAPSLKLGPTETDEKLTKSTKKRYERAQHRQVQKMQSSSAAELQTLSKLQTHDKDFECEPETIPEQNCKFSFIGPLEKVAMSSPQGLEEEGELLNKMRKEVQRLTTENIELKEKISQQVMTPETLRHDEEKVKHFKGLCYATLMALYNFLSPSIPDSSRSTLSKFEKLMLVLMKLRLNLSLQDLGYRFMVSTSCASKTFQDVIHVMFVRMKCLILWPDRKKLQLPVPMEFRKYFGVKVSIIIDCFEVFIERPSNLYARAATWSNYKHHNTAKYLIGITPQGAVSFLSQGWGGRVTDKYLTENSGLLTKLLPGDIVLADRGFDIQESVGLSCAEVKIPAFTRGKKQLSPMEIESTRKISHTRIHVERVIGLVRNKYTILQSIIPVDYLHCTSETTPTIDKINTVCCALSNLCTSVVPID
jgi:hypothetical protein